MISARVKNSLLEIGLLGFCFGQTANAPASRPRLGYSLGSQTEIEVLEVASPIAFQLFHEISGIYMNLSLSTVAHVQPSNPAQWHNVAHVVQPGSARSKPMSCVYQAESLTSVKTTAHGETISKRLGKLFCDYLSFPNF